MALFAILATLTEAGAKDLKGIMERRSGDIRELEQHGVKVVADYALMGGDYDFLYIVEAPDNQTILRQVAHYTQHGVLKFHSMPAMTLDDFARSL